MDRQMELWRMTELRREKGGGGGGMLRTRNKTEMKEERARWVVENSTGIKWNM